MLAGGAESCIHPLAFTGFERSRSLATSFNDTPQQASRPFDKDRNGFIISEGAAILVLEVKFYSSSVQQDQSLIIGSVSFSRPCSLRAHIC